MNKKRGLQEGGGPNVKSKKYSTEKALEKELCSSLVDERKKCDRSKCRFCHDVDRFVLSHTFASCFFLHPRTATTAIGR